MRADAVTIPGVSVLDEIGRGTFGVVYRAVRDGQRCAVKVARRDRGAPRRFWLEAIALARIRHPGIPRVWDSGIVDGRAYLVMEYVEGPTLARAMHRGGTTRKQALQLVAGLADIVAAIHDKGLVHRDIKPKNIAIDEAGTPSLLDFGLVAQVEPLLGVADLAGTRAYAAPEQLSSPHLTDARADLYAIGRVLEELGDDVADPGVSSLLAGLLADDPDLRYSSARELKHDVERVLEGSLPHGPRRDPPPVPETADFVGRTRELDALAMCLRSARRGQGRVAMVRGGSGTGKSRLLRETAARARMQGATWSVIEVSPSDPAPLAAVRLLAYGVVQAINGLDQRRRSEADGVLQRVAASRVATVAHQLSPVLAQLLGAVPAAPQESAAFVAAASELLVQCLGACGHVVVTVDDVDRVDPLSRELFLRVAATVGERSIAVLLGARWDSENDTGQRPSLAAAGVRPSLVTEIVLDAMPAADADALARAYLGNAPTDPALDERVLALTSGTPLEVLEMLRALGEQGILRPYWGTWRFDAVAAQGMELGAKAAELIESRLAALPTPRRTLLTTAAVLGFRISTELLSNILRMALAEVESELGAARRDGLVSSDRAGWSFVHDSVRASLAGAVSDEQRQVILAQAVATLDDGVLEDDATLFAVAGFITELDGSRLGQRGADVLVQASRRAAAVHAHETALRHAAAAERLRDTQGLRLPVSFDAAAAESHICTGALDAGLDALHRALPATAGVERAQALSRIAWIHHMKSDPGAAWACLARAFEVLGARLPGDSAGDFAAAAAAPLVAAKVRRGRPALTAARRKETEVLCALHYQNARLGSENERPGRTLCSAVQMLAHAERLGPCAELALAYGRYGALMGVLGRRATAKDYLDKAMRIAAEEGDNAVIAHTLQMSVMRACFAGDFEDALLLTERFLGEYRPWVEASEYAGVVCTAFLLDAARGRPDRALRWLDMACDYAREEPVAPHAFPQAIVPCLQATLAVLGREDELDAALEGISLPEPSPREPGFLKLMQWSARALALTETGTVGPELDGLVREFEREGFNPRTAHPTLSLYYICVAHARALQCEAPDDRPDPVALRRFRAALRQLRKHAKFPLFRAHVEALGGVDLIMRGKTRAALATLERADAMGAAERAPWVRYVVARAKARLLRSTGRHDMALEQARAAERFATDHGAAYRLALVRQEFALTALQPADTSSLQPSRSSSRGSQLRALINVAHLSANEVGLAPQAKRIVDELLATTDARRGMLLFDPRGPEQLIVGRTSMGGDWGPGEPSYAGALRRCRDARAAGVPEPPVGFLRRRGAKARATVYPLVLHELTVGAVFLERSHDRPPFSDLDRAALASLALQVPLALELGRTLQERNELQDSLQRAARMESVAKLAGTVAHDLGNMLTVVFSGVEGLESQPLDGDQAVNVEMIKDSATKAAALSRQLLSFAQGQQIELAVIRLDEVIGKLTDVICGLVGETIDYCFDASAGEVWVRTEAAALEQALLNVVANARDAMEGGGRLTIRVSAGPLEAVLPGGRGDDRRQFGFVEITDNGCGMAAEVLESALEPFFTTKAPGAGTGLGLASVYAFVRRCDGHLDVRSSVGVGTTVTICLPEEASPRHADLDGSPAPRRSIVLVAAEDETLRKQIGVALRELGYTMIGAKTVDEAVRLNEVADPDAAVLAMATSAAGTHLEAKLRRRAADAPILLLEAPVRIANIVQWLAAVAPPRRPTPGPTNPS